MSELGDISNTLLRTADFEQGTMPPKDFSLVVARLDAGGHEDENVFLTASYDRHLRLFLTYEFIEKELGLFLSLPEIKLSDPCFKEAISLIPTSVSSKSGSGTVVRMMPRVQPILIDFRKQADAVEAVLINGPNLFFKQQEHTFDAGDVMITVREFDSASDMRNQAQDLKFENIATGSLILQKKDGSSISASAAFSK